MEQSDIKSKLIEILKKQEAKVHHIALDINLYNGNIVLKSFRLYDFDAKTNTIKGMTMHEEYAYLREDREPVFAYFQLKEIKQLDTAIANYLFLNQSMHEPV